MLAKISEVRENPSAYDFNGFNTFDVIDRTLNSLYISYPVY